MDLYSQMGLRAGIAYGYAAELNLGQGWDVDRELANETAKGHECESG
jgi:hypothetical protein